jgi:SAM-dependent methyltransferase
MSNPAVEVVRSVRKNGLVHTARLCIGHVENLLFDWRNGTQTTRWHEVGELEASPGSKHAYRYAPTLTRPLRKLFRKLDLPRDGTFLDLGCGKGVVLLLALAHGFRRVVGVDFSAQLCQQARRNVEVFVRRHKLGGTAEIVQGDAAAHAIDDDATAMYVFNAFEPVVWQAVLENVRQSIQRRPRRLVLVYHDPQHGDIVEASGLFGGRTDYRFGPYGFAVYVAEPAFNDVLNPVPMRC